MTPIPAFPKVGESFDSGSEGICITMKSIV